MLNLHLLFVNITSFLIRLLANFSFDSENDSRTIIRFRSCLNIQWYSPIRFLGKPADKNFLLQN